MSLADFSANRFFYHTFGFSLPEILWSYFRIKILHYKTAHTSDVKFRSKTKKALSTQKQKCKRSQETDTLDMYCVSLNPADFRDLALHVI